jgi:hypothetical protein
MSAFSDALLKLQGGAGGTPVMVVPPPPPAETDTTEEAPQPEPKRKGDPSDYGSDWPPPPGRRHRGHRAQQPSYTSYWNKFYRD